MSTEEKLNDLGTWYAQRDAIALDEQNAINTLYKLAGIKDALAEMEAEFAPKAEAISAKIAALEAEVKAEVLTAGATVKADSLQAVWSKGRVTYDSKLLDGYAAAHPEIAPFRKEGEPSVSIRKV